MTQQSQLQQKANELLLNKTVNVIIGYGESTTGQVDLTLITDPAETNLLVWNNQCTQNLTVYLNRKEILQYGKAAIVAKGCDAKSLVVLEIEKQIERESLYVIGMECYGVKSGTRTNADVLAAKCESCDVNKPLNCDVVIEADAAENAGVKGDITKRYERLGKLMSMSIEERLEFWRGEFERCIKCYACRQSCPMCYCSVCVVDKNRPVRIDTSATLKGNFAWNILRAFHLAGRCVGCSACTAACPAGIDLDLLNLSLAKAAEENFNHKTGIDRNANPLIGTFSPNDQEEFIR
ncbi:MAG: 4Fe-4S dicluster domain-containing protein [Planctomycetaceae bacterium]|jgi:ferredoxin|nr:4Fe-4S dicluster domain-containing protein [Planctomycetaceae bacterium]